MRKPDIWLIALCLGLFAALRALYGGAPHLDPDESLFAACAVRQAALHQLPLLACVDTKPPLIFWLYQAGFAIAGDYAMWPLRLFAAAWSLVAAGGVYAAVRAMADRRAALLAATLLLAALSANINFLAMKTELLQAGFTAWALAAFVWGWRWRTAALFFAAGLLTGAAMLAKQPALLLAAGFGAALAAAALFRQWPLRLALMCGLALAAGAVLAAAAGLAAFHGHWDAVVWQLWIYPRQYAQFGGAADRVATMAATLPGVGPGLLLLVLPLVFAGRRPCGAVWALLPAIAGMVAAVVLGKFVWSSYYVMALPGLAIAAGWALDRPPQPVLAAALAALALAGAVQTALVRPLLQAQRGSEQAVAAAIRAAAPQAKALYLWGYFPDLYVETGLMPASRFVVTDHLTGYFAEGKGRVDYRARLAYVPAGNWPQFIADLRAAGPIAIADGGDQWVQGSFPIAAYPAMADFLARQCRAAGAVAGFRLYDCATAP